MKVLLCHNYYQQMGGEDHSFRAEAKLLEAYGHEVVQYTVHNNSIKQMSKWDVARRSFWNSRTYKQLGTIIRRERPVLMHCTNTFPLISTAAYGAARKAGIPVVQSLRNYRLSCAHSALLFRDGKVCEDCLGKTIGWPALVHKCYRDSRAATSVVTAMSAVHHLLGTWHKSVDFFFTPTEFARQKHIQGGLPAEKVLVKPNFIDPDPGRGTGTGHYAVFVGRLSPEKGIDVMLDAWRKLDGLIPLKIIGDGPNRNTVIEAAARDPHIQWLGKQDPSDVLAILGEATCLVMPSLSYETFGRTIIEAYARGTPAIASRLGAMGEIVIDGQTGWHFEPGNADDLADKVRLLVNPADRARSLRDAAREEFLTKYTADVNIDGLLSIYHRALEKPTDREPSENVGAEHVPAGLATACANRRNA